MAGLGASICADNKQRDSYLYVGRYTANPDYVPVRRGWYAFLR